MNNIRGYMVRMWTSDGRVNSEKLFSSENMLEARKQAFRYAQNLAHVMEEARKAGVIQYNTPEEILDPKMQFEEIVIGNVLISVVYEEKQGDQLRTEENIIHMILYDEDSPPHLEVEDEKMAARRMEVFDPEDPETIRVRNREAWYYIRQGGFKAIHVMRAQETPVFLLMDDYHRLKEKALL